MHWKTKARYRIAITKRFVHRRILSHTLAKWLARQIGWGLIGAGIAVAQWDEYAFALALFVGGCVILLLRAYHWKTEYKFLRAMGIVGSVIAIISSYPITKAKKGDKPWSDTVGLWMGRRRDAAGIENRQHLYVELSKERDARIKVNRDDYVANLNYNAMDYQLKNPNLNPAVRTEAAVKRDEFLALTGKTYEAEESEEQIFSGLLAEIKINFPDSPPIREHLRLASRRPQYSVEEPKTPIFPMDSGQHFLDSEGDNINMVLKEQCEQPIDAVLSDMESIIDKSR